MDSPRKSQWRRALLCSLTFTWTNGWVNNRDVDDLRRNRAHYVVILMKPPCHYDDAIITMAFQITSLRIVCSNVDLSADQSSASLAFVRVIHRWPVNSSKGPITRMTSIMHVWQRLLGYCHLRLTHRCKHPAPGQDLIPLQRLQVFAHSRDPHPAIKLWCQGGFHQIQNNFSNWNVLYAVLLEKQIY